MHEVGPELLGRLLDEVVPALVLYARQWCQAPDDVVQEALLQLVRQPRLPSQVVPWLYRVVRNGAISASRQARRRKRYECEAAERTMPWFEPSEGTALDSQAAAAALESLAIEEREAIVAHLWGALSFEEIGELTHTSSSTAHRRYQAGLARLKERLGEACPAKNSARPT